MSTDAGEDQGNAAGRAIKKSLRPVRRRQMVDEVRAAWKVSVRKACAVLRIERSLYTYKSRRGDQAGLKKRIKEITECQRRSNRGSPALFVLLVFTLPSERALGAAQILRGRTSFVSAS